MLGMQVLDASDDSKAAFVLFSGGLKDVGRVKSGAEIPTDHLGESSDVKSQRLYEDGKRRTWELLFALRSHQLELRKRVALNGENVVVEQAESIEDQVILLLVLIKIGLFPGNRAGLWQLTQTAQSLVRFFEEGSSLEDPRKDAAGTEAVIDFIWRSD